MTYQIIRLEKSYNRENIEEIFLALEINDDLGSYNHGKWLNQLQYNNIKNEQNTNFDSWKELTEYQNLNLTSQTLNQIIADCLPIARSNYQESLNRIQNPEPPLETPFEPPLEPPLEPLQ